MTWRVEGSLYVPFGEKGNDRRRLIDTSGVRCPLFLNKFLSCPQVVYSLRFHLIFDVFKSRPSLPPLIIHPFFPLLSQHSAPYSSVCLIPLLVQLRVREKRSMWWRSR